MEKTYPILLDGQAVGEAKVHREGLYLLFSCRCRFPDKGVYTISVTDGNRREELGIPAPDGGSFLLTTRRPAKLLRDKPLVFSARPRHRQLQGKFVPLSSEEPFAYIHRLQEAFLEIREGQVGLVIPTEEI